MTAPIGSGYTCSSCGTFVLYGAYHICGGTPQTPPFYTPLPSPQNEAVVALTAEITRLSGIIHRANDERDEAVAAHKRAERDEQEWRGIVETYGLAERHSLPAQNQERIVITIDRDVLKAAGRDNAMMLFVDNLKKAIGAWFNKGRPLGEQPHDSETR